MTGQESAVVFVYFLSLFTFLSSHMGHGRPKRGNIASLQVSFLRVLLRLFLRKNEDKNGAEGGNIVCGKNKKHHHIIVSKNVVFLSQQFTFFQFSFLHMISSSQKQSTFTSRSNSSHILIVCSSCINIYHDFFVVRNFWSSF